jgi:hypothetical protein
LGKEILVVKGTIHQICRFLQVGFLDRPPQPTPQTVKTIPQPARKGNSPTPSNPYKEYFKNNKNRTVGDPFYKKKAMPPVRIELTTFGCLRNIEVIDKYLLYIST